MQARSTLSPRQFADALGVSESSIKRWADSGRIQVFKTAGGHRRIELQEAVRFIRDSGMSVQKPEILGIRGLPEVSEGQTADPAAGIDGALMSGDAVKLRGILVSMLMGGHSLPSVFDGPLRTALGRVGQLWLEHEDGVLIEHRATAACLQALAEVRALVRPTAPIARCLGASARGDSSFLPGLMVATVLASEGFDAISLGPDMPVESLMQAVDFERPAFVWWSVNHIKDKALVQEELEQLIGELGRRGIPGVLGGRAIRELQIPTGRETMVMESLAELAAFGHGQARAAVGRGAGPGPAPRGTSGLQRGAGADS